MAKKTKRTKKLQVYRFMVSLVGTEPLIWRTFLVHDFIELGELHMLIQMSMGWEARHLYEFRIGGESFASSEHADEMGISSAEGLLLKDVLDGERKFTYIYDFGDNWEHQVEILDALEHDPRLTYPVCTGGENACPPEDCGGVYGYQELKTALTGKDSPEKDEALEVVGGFFDPTSFDPNFVNKYFLWADMNE